MSWKGSCETHGEGLPPQILTGFGVCVRFLTKTEGIWVRGMRRGESAVRMRHAPLFGAAALPSGPGARGAGGVASAKGRGLSEGGVVTGEGAWPLGGGVARRAAGAVGARRRRRAEVRSGAEPSAAGGSRG